MKTSLLMTIIVGICLTNSSCKSKSQRDAQNYMDQIEKTMKENSPPAADQKTKGALPLPPGMEKLVGDWQLVKVVGDDNGNHVLDGEEDKDAITTMRDLLILNANGTCEYSIAKMQGTYEIVTKDDGRKKLVMYDRTGAEVNRGRYIISVTNDELVINRMMGGSDFEVFKRL